MLITRLKVKRGAGAQLSFQARGVIVLLAAGHVALVAANSAFPSAASAALFSYGLGRSQKSISNVGH